MIEAFEAWAEVVGGRDVPFGWMERGFDFFAAGRPHPEPSPLLEAVLDAGSQSYGGQGWSRTELGPEYAWLHIAQLARAGVCRKYSWAVPCEEALTVIADLGEPILDPFAGTGYWAHLLAERGVDVVAYDLRPPPNGWHGGNDRYFEVEQGDVVDVAPKYPDRAMLLCWTPLPRQEDLALRALRAYAGQTIIWIGEFAECSGSEEFFLELEKSFHPVAAFSVPQWDGINDRGEIWRR